MSNNTHSTDAAPLLQAHALEGQRGERALFRDLNLSLLPGKVVWLRGRNGRGKTSLLRILAGLASASAGDIHIHGRRAQDESSFWRSQLLYIGHANALKDDLSATEALAFLAGLCGQPVSSNTVIQQALQRLGVAHRAQAPVRTLSQGQRRRVALARLAMPDAPRLWLLDEPFDALDDVGIESLNELLSSHAKSGGAALLTSHQSLSLKDPAPTVFELDRFAVGA
jgi:heme exporter protein A